MRRVDIAKDDDEEDLYVLFTALDAAGDHDGAAAIRRRIEQIRRPGAYGASWLKSDTDGSAARAKRFSPRYPMGKRCPDSTEERRGLSQEIERRRARRNSATASDDGEARRSTR